METNTNNNRPGANVPPTTSQTNDQLTNMLLQEMIRQMQLDELRQGNTFSSTNQNQSIRSFNRLLDTVYVGMVEYNRNITEYNRNFASLMNYVTQAQQYLEALRTYVPPQRNPSPVSNRTHNIHPRQPNTPTRQGQRRNTTRATSYARNIRTTNNGSSSNVLFSYLFDPLLQTSPVNDNIRPMSREEISNATRTFSYVRDSLPADNRMCPITMEQFVPGDVLCEILGCNHVFRRPALMNWLQRSSQCPVCRYSLRNYNRERANSQTNTTEATNTSSTTPLINTSATTSSTTSATTPFFSSTSFDLFTDLSLNLTPPSNATSGLGSLVPSLEDSILEETVLEDDSDSDIEADLNVD